MGIYDRRTIWQGMPVKDWATDAEEPLTPNTYYRISSDWDSEETWLDRFAQFLAQPEVSQVAGLSIGFWGETDGDGNGELVNIVEAIVGAREKLPRLSAIFVGDMTSEENEISWIPQTDLSPLLTAYPELQHFGVRGSQQLSLGQPKLPRLKSLTIESGGLPVSLIEEVSNAELPALEHLELYLGSANYGANSTVADLENILHRGPEKWPKLTYLGLRDCEYGDALAEALAAEGGAPIVRHIHTLDLSLGTMGDEGVRALAACPAVAQLAKLDIHHHYASDESIALLTALGIPVDVSDAQDESKYGRYVAVSE